MKLKNEVEEQGIDPCASCMRSRRSTVWATPPLPQKTLPVLAKRSFTGRSSSQPYDSRATSYFSAVSLVRKSTTVIATHKHHAGLFFVVRSITLWLNIIIFDVYYLLGTWHPVASSGWKSEIEHSCVFLMFPAEPPNKTPVCKNGSPYRDSNPESPAP